MPLGFPNRPRKLPQQKGFTLVEALIVSAIIAILAAVSIPMYTGYVNNQRIQAVNTLAQTAAVNANALYRRGQLPDVLDGAAKAAKIKAGLFLPVPSNYNISVNTTDTTVTVTDVTDPNHHYASDPVKYP